MTEAARILDLEQHLDRKPANLSGGQRQRVAMGRAIVRNPSAFLMDEPLSNLDAKLRVQMRAEISRIQQRFETTTIYVTHDQTEALTLGDRIAVMRAGILQQVGAPSDLYAHPKNLFVAGFIGSPSMNFLPGEIDGDIVKLPIGDLPLPDSLRRRLSSGPGGGRNGVIVGLRPEDFEDATLVRDKSRGVNFSAKIEVLESMGSEFYAYFNLDTEKVSSTELEELANEAGAADLPSQEGSQVVARLDAASRVRQGQEAELWFNAEHLHLFDPENGQSLLGADGDPSQTPDSPRAAGPAAGRARPVVTSLRRANHTLGGAARGGYRRARSCPNLAAPGCRASTRRATSRARGATPPRRAWPPGCAGSPTTCGWSFPTRRSSPRWASYPSGQVGARVVPLDAIVGTVDRGRDFDRSFRPTSGRVRSRWEHIAAMMRHGESLPPVDLLRIGESYFVRDGHHRVSVARALGRTDIDAIVTEVVTRVGAGKHAHPRRPAAEEPRAGVLRARPAAGQRPPGDPDRRSVGLRASGRARGGLGISHQPGATRGISRNEAAFEWLETEYRPVVEMLREADLIGDRTETEAYMRVCAERYRLIRTHRWDEDVIQRLIEGGARRTRRRRTTR